MLLHVLFHVGCTMRCANAFATVSFMATQVMSQASCRPNSRSTSLNLVSPEAVNDDSLLAAASSWGWISHAATHVAAATTTDADQETGLLSNQAIIATFIIGLVPFAVATFEFWRRIAVGDSFGTGQDSVVIIGQDDAPLSSRGRRVLGKGALVTAYILFGVAAAVLGIVLYAVISSLSLPPPDLPSSAAL